MASATIGSVTDIDELRSLLLTTDQLTARGHHSRSICRAIDRGELVRLRPGYFVEGEVRERGRADRHLLMVLAADRALGSPVFSHWSAALVHGLPSWGLPLRTVAETRSGKPRRSQTSQLMRRDFGRLDQDEISLVDGMRVTSPARTVVDVARTCALEPAVAVADAALHGRRTERSSIDRALDRARGRSGIRAARIVVARADGSSESVAETRSRLIFADFGLPEPERQVDIYDDEGEFVARVDFFWREFGVIGECDGFGKYLEDADYAEIRRRLGAEKDRDAALMALGYRVFHWRWADLGRPRTLVRRLRSVLGLAAAA